MRRARSRSSRRGRETPREPRRRLADVAGRADGGKRVLACEMDGEGGAVGAALGLEADVRVDVGERQTAARVKDEAELRRQAPEREVLGETLFERGEAVGEIERGGRIDVAQRARDDVAQPLDLGVGVDQVDGREPRMQIGESPLA